MGRSLVPIVVVWYLLKVLALPTSAVVSKGFVTMQIGPKPLGNETHVDVLKKKLLMGYDKFARPNNHKDTIFLKLGMWVLRLDANERHSVLIVECLLKFRWNDNKLRWNVSDFGGVKDLKIGDHEVWKPDILLQNGAIGSALYPTVGRRNVIVTNTGEVTWIPTINYRVLCYFDMRHWPFDTQKCHLNLGSWVHSGFEISLALFNDSGQNINPQDFHNVGSPFDAEFESSIYVNYYDCCAEPFNKAVFNITLRRRPGPYYAIVICPAIVTSFFILAAFWLPANSGEKITLYTITAFIINIFLMYLSHLVTITGDAPLLILFFSNNLHIVTFAAIMSTINYTLCQIKMSRPYPFIVNFLLNNKVSNCLWLDDHSKQLIELTHKHNTKELKDRQNSVNLDSTLTEMEGKRILASMVRLEWTIVVTAIDRFYFTVFCFVITVLAIGYL